MAKILSQQIKESESKKQKELFTKKSVPDICGNMGYPPIKDISQKELKEQSLSLYRTHNRMWSTQLRDKMMKEEQIKKEERDLRAKFETESKAFKDRIMAHQREKVPVNI